MNLVNFFCPFSYKNIDFQKLFGFIISAMYWEPRMQNIWSNGCYIVSTTYMSLKTSSSLALIHHFPSNLIKSPFRRKFPRDSKVKCLEIIVQTNLKLEKFRKAACLYYLLF